MQEQFSRTTLILGEAAMNILSQKRIAVFGVGGVGGHVVDALARSGIGALDLIDNDTINISNINRQLVASLSTIGRYKVEVAKEKIADINPQCRVQVYKTFYLPETKDQFDFTQYDYIVDAIDTVSGKISLVQQASESKVPIISSMGAGNKLHPEMFEIADIYSTSVCPLARVMRQELKKRNIKSLKVVYSKEKPLTPAAQDNISSSDTKESHTRRAIPGSTAFTPSVAGLIIAGEIVRDLCGRYING